jgi:hypothetical protein
VSEKTDRTRGGFRFRDSHEGKRDTVRSCWRYPRENIALEWFERRPSGVYSRCREAIMEIPDITMKPKSLGKRLTRTIHWQQTQR